jgi:hypothetical protein
VTSVKVLQEEERRAKFFFSFGLMTMVTDPIGVTHVNFVFEIEYTLYAK